MSHPWKKGQNRGPTVSPKTSERAPRVAPATRESCLTVVGPFLDLCGAFCFFCFRRPRNWRFPPRGNAFLFFVCPLPFVFRRSAVQGDVVKCRPQSVVRTMLRRPATTGAGGVDVLHVQVLRRPGGRGRCAHLARPRVVGLAARYRRRARRCSAVVCLERGRCTGTRHVAVVALRELAEACGMVQPRRSGVTASGDIVDRPAPVEISVACRKKCKAAACCDRDCDCSP